MHQIIINLNYSWNNSSNDYKPHSYYTYVITHIFLLVIMFYKPLCHSICQ